MKCPHCEGSIELNWLVCAHCNQDFAVIRKRGRPPTYCAAQCKDLAAQHRHNVPKVTRLKAV